MACSVIAPQSGKRSAPQGAMPMSYLFPGYPMPRRITAVAFFALIRNIITVLCVGGVATAAEPVARSQTPDQRTGVWVFSCDGQVVRIKAGTDGVAETTSVTDVIAKRTSGRFDGCLVEDVRSTVDTPTIVVVIPHEDFTDADGKRHFSVLGLNRSSLALVNRFDIAPSQVGVPKIAMSTKGSLLKIIYEGESGSPHGTLVSQNLDVSSFTPKAIRQEVPLEILSGSQNLFFREDGLIQTDGGIVSADSTPNALIGGPQFLAVLKYSERAFGHDVSSQRTIALADSTFGVVLYIDGCDTKAKPIKNGRLIAFDTFERQIIGGFETSFALVPYDGLQYSSNVHVTPDGTSAVVEEYNWSQSDDSRSGTKVKTGLLAAYELRSGMLLGKVTVPAASGVGYFVGFSDDSRNLFYADSGKFYIVDATAMLIKSATALPSGFSPIAAVTAQ